MKSLFKAVALITFFSVLTRVAGFFFRIYLSRQIGAEALGVYQVSFSIFMVLLTVVSSGLPLIISRNTAKYISLKDKQKEKSMLSTALIFSLILSVIVCILVFVFKGILLKIFTDQHCINILLALLPAIIFSAISSVTHGWLWGKNNYFGACIIEFFEQVARIVLCVVMLNFAFFDLDGAMVAGVSMTFACVLSAVVSVAIFFVCGGKLGKPVKPWKEIILPSAPITAVRLATSLVQPVIAIIIPLRLVSAGWTNAQAMSMYGIAMGMTLPFLFVPSSIIGSLSMALIPDLSKAKTKEDTKYISSTISSSLLFTSFVSSIFIPLFIGCGEQIGTFFYDNATSGVLLSQAAWIILPIGLTNISSSVLNALGYEVKSLKNYIIGAVLLLISIWFLPKYLGINALIIGMGICMTISSVLNILMIKKITKTNFSFLKPFIIMCLIIIPVSAIVSFVCNILSNFFTLFYTIAVACIVGVVCFSVLCAVFNVIDLQSWFIKLSLKKHFKLPKMFGFKTKIKKLN